MFGGIRRSKTVNCHDNDAFSKHADKAKDRNPSHASLMMTPLAEARARNRELLHKYQLVPAKQVIRVGSGKACAET